MGDEKRSYCTILDEVAKDSSLSDLVETIHHACMSSVLSGRRRVLLIPPAKERKAIAAKKGEALADELRKLIIPHIRGLPAKESITLDKLGDDVMAMGRSALYKVNVSGKTIGGAKIEKIIKAENGIAVVLGSMPESMAVPPAEVSAKPAKGKAQHGGGLTIEIDLGLDGKGTAYLDGLSGSPLRNGILNIYKQLFPAPQKWYQMFTSSFAMFTRYNSYDLMKYTGGIPPYYKWYNMFGRHPYVAAGGILMPYLNSGYAVDETVLRRFIKSPWFAYRDPTVIGISRRYLANGGDYDMEGGGPEDLHDGGGNSITITTERRPSVLRYVTVPVIARLKRFNAGLITIIANLRSMSHSLRTGGPHVYDLMKRNFKLSLKDEHGNFKEITDVDDTTNLARVQLYIDFLDYLLDKTSKLNHAERRQVADEFLKSFDSVIKAIDNLNEENFRRFIGIRLTNYEALQVKIRELLDNSALNGADWSKPGDLATILGSDALKEKMGEYLTEETGINAQLKIVENLRDKVIELQRNNQLSVDERSNALRGTGMLANVNNEYIELVRQWRRPSGQHAALTHKIVSVLTELGTFFKSNTVGGYINDNEWDDDAKNKFDAIANAFETLATNARPTFGGGGKKKKSAKSKSSSKSKSKSAAKPKVAIKSKSSSKPKSATKSKSKSSSKPKKKPVSKPKK